MDYRALRWTALTACIYGSAINFQYMTTSRKRDTRSRWRREREKRSDLEMRPLEKLELSCKTVLGFVEKLHWLVESIL